MSTHISEQSATGALHEKHIILRNRDVDRGMDKTRSNREFEAEFTTGPTLWSIRQTANGNYLGIHHRTGFVIVHKDKRYVKERLTKHSGRERSVEEPVVSREFSFVVEGADGDGE